MPLFHPLARPLGLSQRLRKRILDCGASLILLVLLAPLMACIGLAIKLTSAGPILFRQSREGRAGREFKVFKFRTLYQDQSDPRCLRQAFKFDPRVTSVGRFLRGTGLDELPQLLNVLRGDMSLVGPRPHAVGMSLFGRRNADLVPEYPRRLAVKPGITGWAQVNANRGPIDSVAMLRSRVAFDLFYIQHWSELFDLKIIVLTATQLIKDVVATMAARVLAGRAKRAIRVDEGEAATKFVDNDAREPISFATRHDFGAASRARAGAGDTLVNQAGSSD